MSSMGKTVVKMVGGLEIVCRELTVAGVRQLLNRGVGADYVNEMLFEDVRLGDLEDMTSLSKEQIDGMLPSDLRQVIAGCKEANPDFFEMVAREAKARARGIA